VFSAEGFLCHLSMLVEPLEKGKSSKGFCHLGAQKEGGMFMIILIVLLIAVPVTGICYKAFGY